MQPLISVILPVYNQEQYVAETIESVLSQTFADFELLLHDDGSTDGSAAIIRDYAARDPRIRASFASNAGRCGATNALVAQARGEWCAFLDADDVMLPERLATQLAYHQAHPEVDASSCHCHYINEHGRHMGTQRYAGLRTAEQGQQAVANGEVVLVAFTGLMLSRRVFEQCGGLQNRFWPCDDMDFFNRLLEHGFSLVIIQAVLMQYRIHMASITTSNPGKMYDMVDYLSHCIKMRRAGQAEQAAGSFEQFMALRQHDSWWVKAERQRYRYAGILHREAGFYLRTNDYFGFCWRLATVLLLAPKFTIASIRSGLTKHKSSSAMVAPSS